MKTQAVSHSCLLGFVLVASHSPMTTVVLFESNIDRSANESMHYWLWIRIALCKANSISMVKETSSILTLILVKVKLRAAVRIWLRIGLWWIRMWWIRLVWTIWIPIAIARSRLAVKHASRIYALTIIEVETFAIRTCTGSSTAAASPFKATI